MKPDKRSERTFEPTAQDIREACHRIQEGWSERERNKRAGWAAGAQWAPPLVETDFLFPDKGFSLGDTQYS